MPAALHAILIDDHALFRSGVRMVLERALGGVVVHEAASVEAALQLDVHADVLLVDIQLGGMNGLVGLAHLRERWPQAAVVVVAADSSSEITQQALAAGAHGFVGKSEGAQQMLDVISRVRRSVGATIPIEAGTPAGVESSELSERQRQVLELMAQGLSNRTIGQRLFLSEHTIRWHVQGILAALQASSRSEAIFVARCRGWLP